MNNLDGRIRSLTYAAYVEGWGDAISLLAPNTEAHAATAHSAWWNSRVSKNLIDLEAYVRLSGLTALTLAVPDYSPVARADTPPPVAPTPAQNPAAAVIYSTSADPLVIPARAAVLSVRLAHDRVTAWYLTEQNTLPVRQLVMLHSGEPCPFAAPQFLGTVQLPERHGHFAGYWHIFDPALPRERP